MKKIKKFILITILILVGGVGVWAFIIETVIPFFGSDDKKAISSALEFKFTPTGASISQVLSKWYPTADIYKNWIVEITEQGENKSVLAKFKATDGNIYSLHTSFSKKSENPFDNLLRWEPVPNDSATSKALFKAATNFDLIAFPKELTQGWITKVGYKQYRDLLIDIMKKAGLADIQAFENKIAFNGQEVPEYTLVWSDNGVFTRRAYTVVVPGGKIDVSFSLKGINFVLNDPQSIEKFKKLLLEYFNYFGKGPWETIIKDAITESLPAVPVASGGSCSQSECKVDTYFSMAPYGYHFVPSLNLKAIKAEPDEYTPNGTFYIWFSFE